MYWVEIREHKISQLIIVFELWAADLVYFLHLFDDDFGVREYCEVADSELIGNVQCVDEWKILRLVNCFIYTELQIMLEDNCCFIVVLTNEEPCRSTWWTKFCASIELDYVPRILVDFFLGFRYVFRWVRSVVFPEFFEFVFWVYLCTVFIDRLLALRYGWLCWRGLRGLLCLRDLCWSDNRWWHESLEFFFDLP